MGESCARGGETYRLSANLKNLNLNYLKNVYLILLKYSIMVIVNINKDTFS